MTDIYIAYSIPADEISLSTNEYETKDDYEKIFLSFENGKPFLEAFDKNLKIIYCTHFTSNIKVDKLYFLKIKQQNKYITLFIFTSKESALKEAM